MKAKYELGPSLNLKMSRDTFLNIYFSICSSF